MNSPRLSFALAGVLAATVLGCAGDLGAAGSLNRRLGGTPAPSGSTATSVPKSPSPKTTASATASVSPSPGATGSADPATPTPDPSGDASPDPSPDATESPDPDATGSPDPGATASPEPTPSPTPVSFTSARFKPAGPLILYQPAPPSVSNPAGLPTSRTAQIVDGATEQTLGASLFTWRSSNESIATVDTAGVITAVSASTTLVEIKAIAKHDDTVVATISVRVKDAAVVDVDIE